MTRRAWNTRQLTLVERLGGDNVLATLTEADQMALRPAPAPRSAKGPTV